MNNAFKRLNQYHNGEQYRVDFDSSRRSGQRVPVGPKPFGSLNKRGERFPEAFWEGQDLLAPLLTSQRLSPEKVGGRFLELVMTLLFGACMVVLLIKTVMQGGL